MRFKENKSKGKMTQMTAGDTNQVMGFLRAEREIERKYKKEHDACIPD